jgi:hypothetical protein
MNLSFPQLLAGSVGALLIYCAIVGKTPVAVLKDAFANAGTPAAGSVLGPYTRPNTTSGNARSATFQAGGPGKAAI